MTRRQRSPARGRLRPLALALAGLAAAGGGAPVPGPGIPPPFTVTLGLTPADQRPVDRILRFWSTPLDQADAATPQVLSFSRIFSFADPLEAVQEAPGGLSEAVLQRSYPALAPPFGGDAVDPGGPAGLQLDGARMVSWSLWMVNGIPDAVESVEIAFTSERPWHPFEVAWPAR